MYLTTYATPEKIGYSKNLYKDYCYGFNGMESDDEVKGTKNSYDFGNRFYDNRLGRFLSIDKFTAVFPNESPYSFVGNSPLIFVDVNGDYKIVVTEKAKKAAERMGAQIKIEKFKKIMHQIQAYLNQNPNVLEEIHLQTGMSKSEILNHFNDDGNGVVIHISAENELSARGTKEGVFLDFTLTTWLDDYQAQGKIEEATVNLIFASFVLHEFTHYGDEKLNNKLTNNEDGKQGYPSESGHRGTDTDKKTIGTTVSPEVVEGTSDLKLKIENGERVGGKFILTDTDINNVKRRVTLERPQSSPPNKKKVLPNDQN